MALLPPQRAVDTGKPTLVLDLDGTLVYAQKKKNARPFVQPYFVVSNVLGEEYLVYKRPGLDKFLESMATLYEIVVFSYNEPCYVNNIVEKLDPGAKWIAYRLSRESCPDGLKDLGLIGRALGRVVWLDDNIRAFAKHPFNGLVLPFFFPLVAKDDDTLFEELEPVIRSLATTTESVPDVLERVASIPIKNCNGRGWCLRVNGLPEHPCTIKFSVMIAVN